ncbi:hypothetical protein SLEP1_g16767 [Rubroshorea leprosula]|uniref:Uncharacterized protein n=1 Tax=Rubroshorea leprosula TaxID=152421 RepID=A0AAV5IRZ8_9ROSI|nr:hypothetical protein SLEP1_g16767 [Rubroshorea leprosula]
MKDGKLTTQKRSNPNHSKQLALITKSIVSPVGTGKSSSFKKHEDDSDLMLETDSDVDEPAEIEAEAENAALAQHYEIAKKSGVDYGVQEFCLVLTRKSR